MLLKLIAFGALVVCSSQPALADWKALAALEREGALVSASAIDLGSKTMIQGLHADARLTPASLTKLITTAAALEAWPTAKMFETSLLSTAVVQDGVLSGDLILRGAGDPSLDDHSLWELAAQLKSYDIRAISGHLIVSLAPFGSLGCGTKDRCEALHRSDTAYNAPIASVGVDFGNWCVLVRPGTAGGEAQLRGCGVAHLPLSVSGSVRTVAAGARQTFWVERDTSAQGDALRVGGEIPVGSDQRIYRAMSDSAHGVALLLSETLRELGIEISGTIVVTQDPPPVNARPLAKVEGLTLHEQLGRMLRFSNNYIADVLTMDLAANNAAQPPPDLASAAVVLMQYMSHVQHVMQVSEASTPQLFSGSGLTTENRISAGDLTALLGFEYRDTGHFPAFYGGLTVPRDAPFDFLRVGTDAWLDRVALKTGTLNEPVSVFGIAGYLRKRDGGWIAFAVIVNGSAEHKHVSHEAALRAAQSDLEDILAREERSAAH